MAMALCLTTGVALADPLDSVMKRLEKLEADNRKLREEIELLKAERKISAPGPQQLRRKAPKRNS